MPSTAASGSAASLTIFSSSAGVARAALVLHQPGAGREVACRELGRGRRLCGLRLRRVVAAAREHDADGDRDQDDDRPEDEHARRFMTC